jgi:hypothetical protein
MTRARDVANIDGILTTTGDTYYASAASTPARLGVGSTGQVLTVSGGLPTWATPVSGSMTLLSTTTLSGTSTTISSINQSYKNLYIEVYGATWNTADDSCAFQTNLASALTVRKLNTASVSTPQTLESRITGLDDGAQNQKRTGGNNFFAFYFNNYSSTTDYKTFTILGAYEGGSSGGRLLAFSGGAASDTAINQFIFLTGNEYTLTAGTIKVYGVN